MRAQIVSFHCVLRNQVGKLISSTFNHDVITQMDGQGDQLRGLIDGLQNLTKGEKRRICLAAHQAYGFYDPALVFETARSKLSQGSTLRPGQEVVSQLSSGESKVYRVIGTTRDSVTLDANHPLAGQDLIFEIETTDAREATLEEIEESRFGDVPQYLH